jgi:uncharacterized membrane protein HdeD (DUF308 family)
MEIIMKKNIKVFQSSADVCSLEPNWWIFALRGIFSLIFGCLALSMPVAAMVTMTIFFGAYSIADGIFYLVAGLNEAPEGRQWWSLVLSGLVALATGLIVLISPQIASLGLAAFLWSMISIWAIATGIFQLVAAVRLRREIKGDWLLGLSGLLSILLGGVLLAFLWVNPLASLVTVGILIGLGALAYGIVQLLLSAKLSKRRKKSSAHVQLA